MKKLMMLVLFMLPCLAFTACPPTPVVPTPDADATADVTTVVVTVDDAALTDVNVAVEDGHARKDASPPVVDAGPPTLCQLACANVAKYPCIENSFDGGSGCLAVCTQTDTSKVFDMKPKCLADAKTLAALKACGTVKCTTK